MGKLYTAEVGRFRAKRDRLRFERLLVGIPLAESTRIGRAVGGENDYCPEIIGKGRPSYSGEKLLIPNDVYSVYISRDHGLLTLNDEDDMEDISYVHHGRLGTTLWKPRPGILPGGKVVTEMAVKGAKLDIGLDDVYLLLGAQYPEPQGAKNLEERFPESSYYVRLKKEGSR